MKNLKWYSRFFLEVICLFYIGWLGTYLLPGRWGGLLAAVLVLTSVVLWGVFNVPGDPSRSGKAPIPVKGWLRLGVEFIVFGTGVAGIWVAHGSWAGLILATMIIIHQFQIKERNKWLVQQ